MPRIRSVKPEFFSHPEVTRLTLPSRLLLVSLLTQADDDGRLYDQPRKISGLAFGEDDDISVPVLLEELEINDRIQRYEREGKRCIQIVNFAKHQVIPPSKRRPSTVPPPPKRRPRAADELLDGSQEAAPELPDGSEKGARNREPGTGNLKLSPTETRPALQNGRKLSASELFADQWLYEIQQKLDGGYAHNLSDAIAEVYTQAWQEATAAGDLNPKVVGTRLVAAWMMALDVEPDWARLTKLVAQFGKLALVGLEAGMKNEPDDPYSYAWTVCQRKWDERQAEAR